MSHTDYKQKQAQADIRECIHNMNTMILTYSRPSEKIKENFYRPAHGKIGERREHV